MRSRCGGGKFAQNFAVTYTNCALLTSNEELINPLAENLAIFETSSPSYVFMSSIEKCLDFCKNTKAFDEYIIRLNSFDEKCRELKNIKVLCCGNDNIKNHNFLILIFLKLPCP